MLTSKRDIGGRYMKHTQLFSKILLASTLLAQGSFAEQVKVEENTPKKVKVARLTPAERKQILDDARAYKTEKKQSKNETCKKDDEKCEKEKNAERNLDSTQEKSGNPIPSYDTREF